MYGIDYITKQAEARGMTPQDFVKTYGKEAIYRGYYPDGYSACIKDQECRGNKDARAACTLLMQGDPSQIKRVKGMAKGAIFMGSCNKIFKSTKLGPQMEATAITGSVIVNAVKGKDAYRDTGGVDSTTPGTSVLQETAKAASEKVGAITSGWKLPGLPSIGMPFKVGAGLVVLFVVGIVALIAVGYSGLGGSAGEVASREHKKARG
jgi:hypothetical protein